MTTVEESLCYEWMGWDDFDITNLSGYLGVRTESAAPVISIIVIKELTGEELAYIEALDGYLHNTITAWETGYWFRIPDSSMDKWKKYTRRASPYSSCCASDNESSSESGDELSGDRGYESN